MNERDKAGQGAIRNLVLSTMFVTIGLILPFFTGQIPQIGNLLLPMHIPVFLSGLLCGWRSGIMVGGMLPLLRSVLFGMPVLYPNAIAMSVELAVYGLVSGFLYYRAKHQTVPVIYGSMLSAMILGRIAWGLMEVLLLGMGDHAFTWKMFMAGAFLNAVPGILLQLVLIPAILSAVRMTGVLQYKTTTEGR